MDSIIEVQRNTHEEIERLDQALADVLSRPQVTVSTVFCSSRLWTNHAPLFQELDSRTTLIMYTPHCAT